jgi:hypothetical protein
MHKNATKCNKTQSKWCIKKHGASKIIDTFETYQQPIDFNREDHPITVPRPGNTPSVLKAQIEGYDVDRVFMDAGNGINLIYAKTLRAMHISLEFFKPTDCSFHGIVPGSANYPLGQIALDVCFCNC